MSFISGYSLTRISLSALSRALTGPEPSEIFSKDLSLILIFTLADDVDAGTICLVLISVSINSAYSQEGKEALEMLDSMSDKYKKMKALNLLE